MDLRLDEGWSYAADGGEFRYEDEALRGIVEGDQIALRINNSQPVDLGRMAWTLKGQIDWEDDESFSRMFSIWNEKDPWPEMFSVSSFVVEYASVSVNQGGIEINQKIEDPQNPVFGAIYGTSGSYSIAFELPEPLVLEPGQWRFWFAVPYSSELEIDLKIPPGLTLEEPPLYSSGCTVTEPSELESPLLIQTLLTTSIILDAQWPIDVPAGSALFGGYHGGGGSLRIAEYGFDFPAGPDWEFKADTSGQSASPPDWYGGVLASMEPGLHTYRVVEEYSAVQSGNPKIVYCIV